MVFNVTKKRRQFFIARAKRAGNPEAVYRFSSLRPKGGKIHLDVPGGSIEAGVDQIPRLSNDWQYLCKHSLARNGESQVDG